MPGIYLLVPLFRLFPGCSYLEFDWLHYFYLSGLFLPGIRLYYLLFSLLLSCSCQPVSRNTKFCETRSSFSRNTKLVSHEILENFVRKKFEYQPYYNLYFIFSYNLIRGISSCCSNQWFVSGRTFFLESGSDPDP